MGIATHLEILPLLDRENGGIERKDNFIIYFIVPWDLCLHIPVLDYQRHVIPVLCVILQEKGNMNKPNIYYRTIKTCTNSWSHDLWEKKLCIVMAHWRLTASSQCSKSLTLLRCLHYSLDDLPCTFHAISFSSNLFTKRVTKSSYRWLLFSASFHFYTRASLASTSLCGFFFLKTPKTPLINTAKPVKCRIRSAGVEADIIVHSRRLVRNVHCDWLNIAVRFLNATNRISPFWHTLKREISRCGPRETNVAQCSAIERGSPTMDNSYIFVFWSPQKHKLGRGHWILASCQVSSKSVLRAIEEEKLKILANQRQGWPSLFLDWPGNVSGPIQKQRWPPLSLIGRKFDCKYSTSSTKTEECGFSGWSENKDGRSVWIRIAEMYSTSHQNGIWLNLPGSKYSTSSTSKLVFSHRLKFLSTDEDKNNNGAGVMTIVLQTFVTAN